MSALDFTSHRARVDRITTKVPGLTQLADLGEGESHEPIVRFGMRSFDRQWTFDDPRLIALERPALWASLSDAQVFLATMTTTSLGTDRQPR